MKLRIIILLLIVIVLVSLSWFKVLMAQDLDLLGDEEKRQLLEKYRKQQALKPESYYYQSPETLTKLSQDKSSQDKASKDSDVVTASSTASTLLISGRMRERSSRRGGIPFTTV